MLLSSITKLLAYHQLQNVTSFRAVYCIMASLNWLHVTSCEFLWMIIVAHTRTSSRTWNRDENWCW